MLNSKTEIYVFLHLLTWFWKLNGGGFIVRRFPHNDALLEKFERFSVVFWWEFAQTGFERLHAFGTPPKHGQARKTIGAEVTPGRMLRGWSVKWQQLVAAGGCRLGVTGGVDMAFKQQPSFATSYFSGKFRVKKIVCKNEKYTNSHYISKE